MEYLDVPDTLFFENLFLRMDFFMEVRVRYAPSPTGKQHIGGVRTALFNYLFARSCGGKFILRLEDTDRTRYDELYVKNLFDTMEWLGIEWDEGGSKGGAYGPYVQSERFDLYKEYAQKLVEMGNAYYCFCDAERLERIRKVQTMNKMAPGYDRHCRHLTKEEIDAALADGKPYVIRLKVPLEGATRFNDMLLGDIEWKNEDVNPDPVLLKSDGFPTYHLANVVDDHFMKITHVMRAQEWIPSTPLHILIYQAFGWEPPRFCHLPMVNGADGQKLSKRHGATSVDEFRARGYVPKAIVNYVGMLGCSYEDGRDLYPLADMEKLFKIEHLNKSGAVFDYKKLEWFNGQYIRMMDDKELLEAVLPFITGTGDGAIEITGSEEHPLPKTGPAVSGIMMKEDGTLAPATDEMLSSGAFGLAPAKSAGSFSDAEIRRMLGGLMPLIKERLHFLSDAAEMVRFLFVEPAVPPEEVFLTKRLDTEKILAVLGRAEVFIREIACLSDEEGEEVARKAAEEIGVKLGDFMMPIRLAVTGSKVSPPLIGSIRALGYEKALARVERAVSTLSGK